MNETGWRNIEIAGGLLMGVLSWAWPNPPPLFFGLLLLLSIALLVDGIWRVVKHPADGASVRLLEAQARADKAAQMRMKEERALAAKAAIPSPQEPPKPE